MEITNVQKTTSKIRRISPAGKSTTYDFTVKDTHRILANGFYTSNCNHPEVETFINIKRDLKKVTGANISVRLTDEFMNAVKNNEDFTLRWPVEVPASEAKVTKVVKARELWSQIIDAAWTSAEPGLLFWDTVKKMTPTEAYASKGYANVSTNPCAELILSPYDSCRLLLINLTKFVKDAFLPTATFDFDKFKTVAAKAQKLMDDLVDLEIEAVDSILKKIDSDPESPAVKHAEVELWTKIRKAASGARRTGLGITGIGDALAEVGVTYGSQASVEKTGEIYRSLALAAYRSSVDMARDRGPFPVYEWSLENDSQFLRRIMEEDKSLFMDWKKHGRRNIALTTTAPAGSVSCLTQTTSGIEPAYLLSYTRRKKINPNDSVSRVDFTDQLGDKWQEYKVYHHGFKKWMDATGKTDEQVSESPYWKATSNDVDWKMSVELQSAAQRYVCHAISKTCNLPNDVTREVVADVYMAAWEAGCKGFTVYRDGCRSGVLVQDAPKEAKKVDDSQPDTMVENHAPKRPKELPCDIHRINVKGPEGQESYLVLVGKIDGKPYEIFCGRSAHVEVPKKAKTGTLIKNGKKDGVATYNLQIPIGDDDHLLFKDIVELFSNPNHGAFTRTLSLSLRHGVPMQYIVEQLQKDKHSEMQSFSRVLTRVLKGYIPDGVKSTSDKTCPSCGSEGLVYKEGCVTCEACSYSKCG